jgi:hypothetical protein
VHWEGNDGEAAWSNCLDAKTAADAVEAAKVAELAYAFAAELATDIGPNLLQMAIERNASPEYQESGSCASHDFCDANMTMERAWESTFPHEPVFVGEDMTMPDDVLNRWNRAWTFAREHAFFTVCADLLPAVESATVAERAPLQIIVPKPTAAAIAELIAARLRTIDESGEGGAALEREKALLSAALPAFKGEA